MNQIYSSWEKIHEDSLTIASRVRGLDFHPDMIVCNGSAAQIAAIVIINQIDFNVPIITLNWSKEYKDTSQVDKIAISVNHGKKVLFISDVICSGNTLSEIKARFFDTKNNVLYSTLWYNPNQVMTSIHVWANISNGKKVSFPYM